MMTTAPRSPREAISSLVVQFERIVLRVGIPGVIALATGEVIAGRGSSIVAGNITLQIILALVIFALRKRSMGLRASAIIGFALTTQAFAILHFGPVIGGGPIVVLAALLAGVAFGRRGAVGVGIAMGLLSAIAIAGTVSGFFPVPDAAGNDLTRWSVWIRKTMVFSVGVAAAAWLAMRITDELEASVRGAEEALHAYEQERTRRVVVERELERAERLQVLGRLAGGVGHEVNHALDTVFECAHRMASARNQDDEIARDILDAAQAVRQTARRLAALQPGQDPSEATVVGEAVSTEVQSLKSAWADEMVLQCHVSTDRAVALAPESIRRLARNLCLNAKDASPPEGSIVVRVAAVDDDSREGVVLEVRDEGRGMSEEERECIFDPFFTTKGELGTGLGLTEVHRMVHAVGGHIEVTSRVGRGTTVRVVMPCA